MKVLHFVHYAQGGIVTVVLEQIRHAPSDVDYHLVFLERTDELERLLARRGVQAHFLEGSALGRMLGYRRLLRTLAPDVIHLHSYLPRQMTALAKVLGWWRGRTVSTLHSDYPYLAEKSLRSRAKRLSEAVALRTLRGAVIVSNDQLRSRIATSFRMEQERIHRIYNGVSPAVEEGARPAESAPVAVAIGRFVDQKNFTALLDAWAGVVRRQPDARLWLIGDGPQRERLIRQAQRLEIAGSVVFWGWVSRERVGELLAQARLFVLSSLFESLPTASIEAAMAGLPVVSTEVAGIADVIEHERTGLIVPASAALTDALVRLLDDPALCAAMGARGRARAQRLFGAERFARETESLYAPARTEAVTHPYAGIQS